MSLTPFPLPKTRSTCKKALFCCYAGKTPLLVWQSCKTYPATRTHLDLVFGGGFFFMEFDGWKLWWIWGETKVGDTNWFFWILPEICRKEFGTWWSVSCNELVDPKGFCCSIWRCVLFSKRKLLKDDVMMWFFMFPSTCLIKGDLNLANWGWNYNPKMQQHLHFKRLFGWHGLLIWLQLVTIDEPQHATNQSPILGRFVKTLSLFTIYMNFQKIWTKKPWVVTLETWLQYLLRNMISWKRSGFCFRKTPQIASSVSNLRTKMTAKVRASTRDLHVLGTSRLEASNPRQIPWKSPVFEKETQKSSQKSGFFSSRSFSNWIWCWLVLFLWWDNSWWHMMVQFYSKQWRTLWDKGRKHEIMSLVGFQSQIFPGKLRSVVFVGEMKLHQEMTQTMLEGRRFVTTKFVYLKLKFEAARFFGGVRESNKSKMYFLNDIIWKTMFIHKVRQFGSIWCHMLEPRNELLHRAVHKQELLINLLWKRFFHARNGVVMCLYIIIYTCYLSPTLPRKQCPSLRFDANFWPLLSQLLTNEKKFQQRTWENPW